jgi:hypothetical protein
MPILADTGIEFPGEPEIFEVHPKHQTMSVASFAESFRVDRRFLPSGESFMRGRVLTATERTAARRSERGPPLEPLSAGPAQPLGDSAMGGDGI